MDATKLDNLAGLVDEVDGESPQAQAEQAEQAQQADTFEAGARDWGMVAFMVGKGLSLIAPELERVYSEDACMGWGRAMMPVADKHGWNSPSSVPELGLLIVSLGLGVPSALAIRERMRQLKEERANKATAAAAGSGDGS